MESEKSHNEYLSAVKCLQIADHMAYITYPLVNDKRLLLKIFDEIYKSVSKSINAAIYYESTKRKLTVYSDDNLNIELFFKFALDYGLNNEQIRRIIEINNLNKKHKKSSMEFVRKDKVIILSDDLNTNSVDINTIKIFLLTAKELVVKIGKKINEK